jgi:hypothetical protein
VKPHTADSQDWLQGWLQDWIDDSTGSVWMGAPAGQAGAGGNGIALANPAHINEPAPLVLDSGISTAEVSVAPAGPAIAGGALAHLANAAYSFDAITNAGVNANGATAAQLKQALNESGLSVNGSGIKIGVLSDSFNNLGGAAADEASGALPSAANINIIKDLASGGEDEGRAMMQIIHEIAPGASLSFYTAFDGEQDFANGILALAASGAKVIVDDVSYFDEPFFQNGVIAQAIQTVVAQGVTYITSAGNDGSAGYQAAWSPISGSFTLAGRTITLTDAQNFGGTPFQTVTVNSQGTGESIPLLLQWNQAYGTVSAGTADLEILVYNSSGQLVGTATNATYSETTNPWVEFDLPNTGSATATYYIAIENLHTGTNPGLIKEILAGNGLPATISGANTGTVFGHAMTPGVITAGAVSTAATPAFGISPAFSEGFSSSGAGTQLLFANNGTPLSSPLNLSPVVVSGVDHIATTVPGGLSDFYGTSASAASLAGVAALILSANSNLTPAQVAQIMQQTALPMANSAVSGAGLVQVNQAVAAAMPSVTIEAFGSTTLVRAGVNYFLNPVAGGAGPELKYNGVAVVTGQYGNYLPVAAETTGSGYEVAFKDAGSGQFSIWSVDGNGNYLSNIVGIAAGNSTAVEAQETVFHQDLNGDGTIGVPGGSGTTIEAIGTTSLVRLGNNYFLNPVAGGTGPELKYNGAPVVTGQYGTYLPIAAEAAGNGYEVAFKDTATGQFSIWSVDSNGNYLSNIVGIAAGSSSAVEAQETVFHQDLNGDGTIGVVGVSGTTIEAIGATSLVQLGNNYFLNPVAGGTGPELKYNGAPVTTGQYGTYLPIAAEAAGSGYEVAFKDTATGQFSIWSVDGNGNYVSNIVGIASGNSSAVEAQETVFHQDLNGDGTIGIVGVSNTTIEAIGTTSLVQNGTNYFLNPVAGGTGPELKYNGMPVVTGQYGTYLPIAAEAAGSGYEVAFKDTATGQFSIWSVDGNGNYISNIVGIAPGNSTLVEAQEPAFHQDLNGDGVIGIPGGTSVAAQQASIAAPPDGFHFAFAPAGNPSTGTDDNWFVAQADLHHQDFYSNTDESMAMWNAIPDVAHADEISPGHVAAGAEIIFGHHFILH